MRQPDVCVIGVDVAWGKPTAVAQCRGNKYGIVSEWQFKETRWFHTLFDDIADMHKDTPVIVVVERMFLGKNVKAFGQLCECVGMFRYLSALHGFHFAQVAAVDGNAKGWYRELLSVTRKADAKPLYMLRAKSLTGRDDLTDDESAAVCLADWGKCNAMEILGEGL
ncbi:MAG: hypothetical protein GY832_22160 [Chloroflexi bacterium]|nr:hypothetical protein [Chloroflexota bacterium]